MNTTPGSSAVAKEAMALAVACLDVGNLSKALHWSATAAELGHPGAGDLWEACDRVRLAHRAAATSQSSREAFMNLRDAATTVGHLMVAAAQDLGEEILSTAQGYADGQVLQAADMSFAQRLFDDQNPSLNP